MSPKDLHHGFEHSLRVRNYALQIGKREGADLRVVEISSFLHDIGRGREENGEYHTETSARFAASFLRKFGLSEEEIGGVVHSVECHSRKKEWRKAPRTLEAKVLYDADGLEMIGAVGILRTVLGAALLGKDWSYVVKKAKGRLSIIDDFLTLTGKKIAEERRSLVSEFVIQLTKELSLL